jgi:hypothetical protein
MMEIETTAKETKPTTRATKPMKRGYKPAKGEENTVIVKLRVKGFNPETGEPIGKPYVYKTDVRFWNQNFLPHMESQGLEVIEVLNLPKGANKPSK